MAKKVIEELSEENVKRILRMAKENHPLCKRVEFAGRSRSRKHCKMPMAKVKILYPRKNYCPKHGGADENHTNNEYVCVCEYCSYHEDHSLNPFPAS